MFLLLYPVSLSLNFIMYFHLFFLVRLIPKLAPFIILISILFCDYLTFCLVGYLNSHLAYTLSAFQDMNQLHLGTEHLGEASEPERPGSGGSIVGSSAVASKSISEMSDFGSDSAYETSDIGTSNQMMIHVSETSTEAMALFPDLSAPVGEISNGDLMEESVFSRPGEFLSINSQRRKENLALGRDSFNGSPLREKIEFIPEQDRDKHSGHSRKLSVDSIGSDVSSIRGSELSVPGVANSISDGSVDYTGGEARSSIEAVSSMEAPFLNDAQIILPLDQQHKLNRVLVTMQRRLVVAKTDMEDLIARLNQEITVKEYLTTKVHLCIVDRFKFIILIHILNNFLNAFVLWPVNIKNSNQTLAL